MSKKIKVIYIMGRGNNGSTLVEKILNQQKKFIFGEKLRICEKEEY